MKTVYSFADEKMTKTISALKNEYASIRAGRASAAVLDKIRVDYYGTPTPVNQLAEQFSIDPDELKEMVENMSDMINSGDMHDAFADIFGGGNLMDPNNMEDDEDDEYDLERLFDEDEDDDEEYDEDDLDEEDE